MDLRCELCECVSTGEARGWVAFIACDPDVDDPPVTVTYCPPCAEREFEQHVRLPYV